MQIDKDQTYQTRDGREVRIYEVHSEGLFPVHGAYKSNGMWHCDCWPLNGRFLSDGEHKSDLVLVPKRHTREVWINMYLNGPYNAYKSEEYACSSRLPNCIACKHLVFEFVEGEGL